LIWADGGIESIPQGLKPRIVGVPERPKAKASGYLEAKHRFIKYYLKLRQLTSKATLRHDYFAIDTFALGATVIPCPSAVTKFTFVPVTVA
jgi:hypothetical protein